MEDEKISTGNVAYDRVIIKSIIKLATKEIGGILDLNGSIFKSKMNKGIKVKNDFDGFVIDVYINIFSDSSVADISWRVQENIRDTIQSMLDIKVKAVNVHVINVDFSRQEMI